MSEVKKLDMAASAMDDADCLLVADSSGTVKRISLTELLGKVKVGGRNLVADSDKGISNSDYRMGAFNWASKPVKGENLLVTIYGELDATRSTFAVFNGLGDGNLGMIHLHKVSDGVYSGVLNIKVEPDEFVSIYTFPNDTATHGVSTIERIKIERGNIITDWSPAPEDLRGGVIPYGSNSYICVAAKPEKGGRHERRESAEYKCGGISSAGFGDDEKRKYARYFRFVSDDSAGNILCHCQHAAPSDAGGRQIRCSGSDEIAVLLTAEDYDGQAHRMAALERYGDISRRVAGHGVIVTVRGKEVVAA